MPKEKSKGYANNRMGADGLNLQDPNHVLGPNAMRRFTNMFPTAGGCESRYGFELWNENTARTGGIPFMHFYRSADGTKKQIIFSNDDDYFYLDSTDTVDDTWNTIGDMGTVVDNPSAYTYNDLVIFGTGHADNTPKKWSGSAYSNITTPASATADLRFYEFFQGQDFAALFGAGDPELPSRLYYSSMNDPDDWATTGGYIDIALNDGQKITGLIAQGNQLIVYKGRNRYYVSTFYESNTGAYGVRVSPFKDNSGGTESHETIQVTPSGDILALAHKEVGVQGVGKLQAADGSLIPKEYSYPILPLFEQVEYAYAYKARGVFWDRKYWLAVPYGRGQTTNNYVFVLDVDREVPAWTVLPDVNIGSWLIAEDEDGNDILYAGDANLPRIYKFSDRLFDDNGEKINSIARTGKINLGTISDYSDKFVLAVEGFKREGDDLTLTVMTDGVETEYAIGDDFLVTNSNATGFIGSDYIAEEYIGSGADESSAPRFLAILIFSTEQRLNREIEVQLANDESGAYWGWSHLTIDELTPDKLRMLPEKYIITEPK